MESDIIPLHPSSPPPLDDDDEGSGSDEDEFGDFGRFPVVMPCSGFGSAETTSNLRQPSPTIKPDACQPMCSFNCHVEQSQPTSTVNSGSSCDQTRIEEQHCHAEASLHLTNGHSERECASGIHKASMLVTCSQTEETGFADFTVFAEQAAHPWCCGFSPVGHAEQWNGREGLTNVPTGCEQSSSPGHEVIMDSEPKSYCAYSSKENMCAKVKHGEKEAAEKASQDCPQTLDFSFEESHLEDEELSKPGENQKDRKHSVSLPTLGTEEDRESEDDGDEKEESASTLFQTASIYESVTEDMASFGEDSSVDEPSEDFEPNVSSLASQENETDSEEDDQVELRNYRLSKSFCKYDSWHNVTTSHPDAERCFYHYDQSATQESSATSIQSESNTEDELPEFRCDRFEHHMDQDHVQTVNSEIQHLGSLPPSDSFADFCSAPTQEDGEAAWAAFQDQTAQVDEQCKEQKRCLQDKQDWAGQCAGSKRNSCQDSPCCRIQQLLQTNFPEAVASAEEDDCEVPSLDVLINLQQRPNQEQEEVPGLTPEAQRVPLSMWWPYQDIHSAAGLHFQWGGSHTNRALLMCLGVDTRNIVFMGIKKQPVVVPAFASNLGMLEPTKDSVPAVCSPGHTVVTPQAPSGPQDRPNAPADSMQEGFPSYQLNWSSRGLSSSQDGTSPRRTPHFWGWK